MPPYQHKQGTAWPVEELLKANFPEPRWVIKDVLPEGGKMMIYGPAETFKSALSTDMACSIANGEACLCNTVFQGVVLIWQVEMNDIIWRWRTADYKKSKGKSLGNVYMCSESMKLDRQYDFNSIYKEIDRIRKDHPGLLITTIFDPCYAMMSGDINSSVQVKTMTDNLNILNKEGIATVLIHHSHKPKYDIYGKEVYEGNAAASGSSDFVNNWPETSLRLKVESREPDKTVIACEYQKHRHARRLLNDIEIHWKATHYAPEYIERNTYRQIFSSTPNPSVKGMRP